MVPGKQRMVHDRKNSNRVLVLDLAPEDSGKTIDIRFAVRRIEKAAYAAPEPGEYYLAPDRLGPITEEFRTTARNVVSGKKEDLVRARALYDHVIDRMRYMKYGDGWGKGDAVYACSVRTGNCTDFHAYFIALGPVDRHSRAFRDRSRHSLRAKRRRHRRLSLLGRVLCRWQVVARGHQ